MAVDIIDNKSTASEFLRGMRASVPVIVAVLPFGLLFGALAVDNGFSVFEAMLMSATVYGGASQMVGIELFGQKVAPWLIVLSIFAVNFRHVLYSAAFGRLVAGWPIAAEGRRLLPAQRSAIRRDRAQARGRRGGQLRLVFRPRRADLGDLGGGDRARRLFRPAGRQRARARARLPAADLFPRPGHELPQPAAVAAGRGGKRRRVDHRLQDRRLALARLDRRRRRRAACGDLCAQGRRRRHERASPGSSSPARS